MFRSFLRVGDELGDEVHLVNDVGRVSVRHAKIAARIPFKTDPFLFESSNADPDLIVGEHRNLLDVLVVCG